jgi:hypothetical protein
LHEEPGFLAIKIERRVERNNVDQSIRDAICRIVERIEKTEAGLLALKNIQAYQ